LLSESLELDELELEESLDRTGASCVAEHSCTSLNALPR
jgi:hypothetical protein